MKNLCYRITIDQHKKPLILLDLEGNLGHGQEISPDALRSLGEALIALSEQATKNGGLKHALPITGTLEY